LLSIRRSKGVGNWFRMALLCLGALLALPCGLSQGASRPPEAACPLTTPVFKARLDARHYAAGVGSPAHVRVRLTPAAVPEGFFVTCIIDVLSGPSGRKPAILTGYPVSDVTAYEPGEYRLRVLVNLIAKSSCGGVKAVTLLDREVTLTAQ